MKQGLGNAPRRSSSPFMATEEFRGAKGTIREVHTIGVRMRYKQRVYLPQPVLGEPLNRCCLERLSSIDDNRASIVSQF